MTSWIAVVGGLALLLVGGELLVRGSVQVATRLGVSPLVIGLTLVGFGTSTPELVASLQAALSGAPGIAYGNIVGSNIANILLILGASAVIGPIAVQSRTLKRDGLAMVATALAFAIVAIAIPPARWIGAAFIALLGLYIYSAFRQEKAVVVADHGAVYDKAQATRQADPALAAPAAGPRLPVALATALAGLAIIIVGGYFLVEGAVGVARDFGVSETVIGLTIVAVGTSMPELVTSLVAAARRQSDVALGNIIGSNIYNILGIGGVTALIAPSGIPDRIVTFDNPVMVAVSLAVVAMAYTGARISRWEGGLLLAAYAGYIAWLWPKAAGG